MKTTDNKFLLMPNLNGGLSTRPNPLLEEGDPAKKMYSPALRNVDMFRTGAINKRLGKTIQGSAVSSSGLYASQTTKDTGTAKVVTPSQDGAYYATKLPAITGPITVNQITVSAAITQISTRAWILTAEIWTDNSGTPLALHTNGASSNNFSGNATAAQQDYTFNFNNLPVLSNTVVYWIVVKCVMGIGLDNGTLTGYGKGTGSALIKTAIVVTPSSPTWSSGITGEAYYLIYIISTALSTNGVYDYRFSSSSTQRVMAAVGGGLYFHSRNATPLTGAWSSNSPVGLQIATGLGSGQDVLWDFKSLKNYLFTNDYGTNIGRVWEGASTGTMKLGYRLTPWYTANFTSLTITSIATTTITLAASQPATGIYVGKIIYLAGSATLSPQVAVVKSYTTTGTVGQSTYYVTTIVTTDAIYTDHTSVRFNGATLTDNNGAGSINTSGALTCFSILQVTTLKSGGFRAAEFSMDTEAGNTSQIEFTNVKMNATTDGTEYGFDIPSQATTWYMSAAFDPTIGAVGIYYKIPTANMSTGNPATNATTAFNITTIANLTTSTTLLDDYGFEQGYFTDQADAPYSKYMEVFQNMLCATGDAANPSRVWISALNSPNIYSVRGGLDGNYLDFNPNDGDLVIGIKQWNGVLFVSKRKSFFAVEFTGVEGQPFYVRQLSSTLGALSHWSIKEVANKGLVFLSQRGPAICYGTIVQMLPSASNILDRFDPNNSSRYNLAAMAFTTAGINVNKSQVHWGVSSTSATTRDLTLVYDYEKDAWWENDVSANYYTEVTDGNYFPSIWSGDYSAQVFQHDSGTNDNGSAIDFYFETPNVSFGAPFYKKFVEQLFVAGTVQSSGTLSVDVFLDFAASTSTPAITATFDMSDSKFKSGMSFNIGKKAAEVRFRVRQSTIDVPVQIDALGFTYQVKEMVP